MKLSENRIIHRKLRAPQEPNTALIEPSPLAVDSTIATNRRALAAASTLDVVGLSLDQLTAAARQHLYRSALQFTGQYRSVSTYATATPPTLILSGHQPELFHPGVWFKNVALSEWSREQRAVGIQLLVDSDLCRTAAIRVPTGTLDSPSIVDVQFDVPTSTVPFEERPIHDAGTFGSFDQRIQSAIESLVPEPLVVNMWSYAREAADSGSRLGYAIAQARHRLEYSWGLNTLELPWSVVCDTDGFRRFALAILLRLPEFQAVHNHVLREYRAVHKIRGRARPVAELHESSRDGWLETPFWCWSTQRPQRQTLLVRLSKTGMELRSANTNQTVQLDRDIDTAIEQWAAARSEGFKIRSRALVTTMYTRLVLSDLFLHGIGGAKYDELTDEIISQFWNVSPPEFMVLSATVPLPIARPAADADDLRRIEGMLRDLWFHPEHHVDLMDKDLNDRGQCVRLITEKRRWIELVPSHDEPSAAKRRHEGIVLTTESLREHAAPLRAYLLDERAQLLQKLRHSAVLSSREYSFCLFPENRLRQTLLDLLR